MIHRELESEWSTMMVATWDDSIEPAPRQQTQLHASEPNALPAITAIFLFC